MVKLLSARGPVSRSGPVWIVCVGTTLDVSRGRVKCPQRGILSAKECLACHLLVAVADERNLRFACSTVD